ncbi:MAG: GntR family transcriptional regulator [Lentisphaeria bacterium]|nr:GntR family transcriptional regulator [Lentisphaeria bacterium]
MKAQNKSDLLYESMFAMIRDGEFKSGDKFPSEYELAERFNVNKTTANKVVARLVSSGYLIRTRGRGGTIVAGTPQSPKGVIGYKLQLLSGQMFSSRLLYGAQQAASAHNYAMQYIENGETADDQWEKIAARNLAGLLLTSSSLPPEGMNIPYVNIDVNAGNHIYSDDFTGGGLIAEHLFSRGHRKVVIISNLSFTSPRIRGFCAYLNSCGLPEKEIKIFPIPPSGIFNPLALWQEIRRTAPETTGIFCSSDAIAMQLIFQLKEIGIECPRDISICGYGNMPLVNFLHPVTSVDQFTENLGYSACCKLIEIIEKRNSDPLPLQLLTPVKLINPNATAGQVADRRHHLP